MAVATDTPTLPVEAVSLLAGKFEAGIRKGGEVLRKLAVSERTARVTLGRWLSRAYEAGMTLAPTGDARKPFESALQAQLVEWVGVAPRTGELYPWQSLRSMIVASQVIDGLPQDIRGALGIDAAGTIASIPGDAREAFVRERLDKGESVAPRAIRPAVHTYLVDNGHRVAPTLRGRTSKVVQKWQGSDEASVTLEAVARLNPRKRPERRDDIAIVVAFALRVAGLDVKSDAFRIAREATAELVNPVSS